MVDIDPERLKEIIEHILGCRIHLKQLPKQLLELQDNLCELTTHAERLKKVRHNIKREPVKGTPSARTESKTSSMAEVAEKVVSLESTQSPGKGESRPSFASSRSSKGSIVAEKVSSAVRAISSSIREGSKTFIAERLSRSSSGAVGQESRAASLSKKPSSAVRSVPSAITEGGEATDPTRTPAPEVEISFAVKEDQQEPSCVEVIELEPAEEAMVLDDVASPEEDAMSDDSEIGVYFIDDVHRVRLILVIQRELCALGELCPTAKCIVAEISKEFDHFKECCKCMNKVFVLLPEILKEIQELIKYMKKKRNERYKWPDDSPFLRRSSEINGRPSAKESGRKRVRKETVGFVTVEIPRVSREPAAMAQHLRRCSVKVANRPLVSMLQTEAQSELRVLQKLEVLEQPVSAGGRVVYPTEYSCLQFLRFLMADPVFETALQLSYGESKLLLEEELDGEKISRDLSTDMRDLKELMLDVRKSQIEFRKILLNDGTPVQVRSDPLEGGCADSCGSGGVQRTLSGLKNTVISALLKGISSSFPRRHSEEVAFLLQQLHDFHSRNISGFRWNPYALSEAGKKANIEEISSDGEIMKMVYSRRMKARRERTRVCFSEIISKDTNGQQSVSSRGASESRTSCTGRELESQNLLKAGENTGSVTSVQSGWCVSEDSKRKMDSREATINVTIKIGEDDAGSLYDSASSIHPSGGMLQGKKSETWFLLSGNGSRTGTLRPEQFLSEVSIPVSSEEGKMCYKLQKCVKKGQSSTVTFKFKLPVPPEERSTLDKLRKSENLPLIRSVGGPDLEPPLQKSPCPLTLQKLRSRIRDATDQIENLKNCVDRTDLLADKLISDAHQNVNKFKDISNRCYILLDCLNP